ncbi:MAG: ATP-binding protein [Tateyamaria sp.]|uniref:ATP-binding protein n=1 Tax=Tateyamaria sp. TaxID=1929288 RepID=UPI00329AE264
MIEHRYHMKNTLEDVDPMVMSLKDCVCGALEPSVAFRFEVCASETLKNIVKHAKPVTLDGQIDVTLTETKDTLLMTVFDPVGAAYFDLRDHAPDLETVDPLAESGRGLGLIMHCADTVDYGMSKGRNRLVLSFKKGPQVPHLTTPIDKQFGEQE